MHPVLKFASVAAFASLLGACSGAGTQTPLPASPSGSGITAPLSHTLVGENGEVAHAMFTKDPLAIGGGGNGTPGHIVPMAVNNMTWHGGPVQHTPKVYIIQWGWKGSDPSGVGPRMQSFFSGTGGSQWQSSQTQYTDSTGHVGNQTGEYVATWVDNTNPVPSRITQSALAAEAVRAIAHFGSGSYSVSTNYIVASPHGHSMSGFATQWCAWHSSTSSSYGTVSYTYMPYMPDGGASCGANSVNSNGALDGVTIVGGHEQAETMTDPQPNSGWLDSSNGETGDKCAWTNLQNTPFSTGTFPTQPLWSNSASGCVQ